MDNLNHGLPRDIHWHSALPAMSDRSAQIPDYYEAEFNLSFLPFTSVQFIHNPKLLDTGSGLVFFLTWFFVLLSHNVPGVSPRFIQAFSCRITFHHPPAPAHSAGKLTIRIIFGSHTVKVWTLIVGMAIITVQCDKYFYRQTSIVQLLHIMHIIIIFRLETQ